MGIFEHLKTKKKPSKIKVTFEAKISLERCLGQKTFVDFLFEFAWEFCIENWRGFLVKFSGLCLPRKEARKLLKRFGENSEQNSGRNFEKFGKLSFCNSSDLTLLGNTETCTKIFWCTKIYGCNGQIIGQPRKGNVDKMSEKMSKRFRGEKTNKHKQLFGIVPGMGGGQICLCVAFFLGKKGNT